MSASRKTNKGKNVFWHGSTASSHMSTMLMVPPSTDARDGAKASDWAVVVMQTGSSKVRGIVAWHLLDKFLHLKASAVTWRRLP